MPEHLTLERDGSLQRILLDRPPVNALNLGILQELREALTEAEEDGDIHGVLLGSAQERFSAGLDLPEISTYDEGTLTAFADAFLTLFEELYAFPKPLVAAIPGHCIAGGLLLVAPADHRVAAAGDYKLVMKEVDLGLPMPEPEAQVLTELVGFDDARELLLHGTTYDPEGALGIGLVDRVVPPEDLDAEATALLESLAEKPLEGYAGIKRSMRAPLLDRIRAGRKRARETALSYFE